MPRFQPVVRSQPVARLLLFAAVTAALASCASNESPSDQAAASTPAPRTASAKPTAPATATATRTSLPVPADGKDVRSCADGSCEIRVAGQVTVELPERFGLGSIQVTGVNTKTVTMVVPLAQSEFSSDGGCGGTITGGSGTAPGYVAMACHAGEKTVLNEMSLEVRGIAEGAAVLRVRPTK